MSGIFSDADLQALGDLAVDLALKDTCDILRSTPAPLDEEGNRGKPVYNPVNAQPIPCAVVNSGEGPPAEQVTAQQVIGQITQIVLLPRATDVRGDDRIRVTSGLFDNQVYRVRDIYEPTSYEVLRRVSVLRSSLPT